jgi:predicted dehydrogenase
MATTVRNATAMIHAAEEAGVVLYVAENQVHDPLTRRLTEIVRTGELVGHVAFGALVAGYRAPNPSYPGRRARLTHPEAGGSGTWMLQGVHAVARCRQIFGEVHSVYALEHRTPTFARPDLEATMAVLLTLTDGVPVWLAQTPEVPLSDTGGVRIYGDQGVAIGSGDMLTVSRPGESTWTETVTETRSSYALEIEAFANNVTGGRSGPTTGRSERRTLAVVEAALESARSGNPVTILERFPELVADVL